MQMRFVFRVQEYLSHRLFSTYLEQAYSFFLQRNSAQLIRNVVNDINLLTYNAILPGLLLATEMMVLCGFTILLLAFEPIGTILVAGPVALVAFVFHHVSGRSIVRWGRAFHHHEGLRIQQLQQGLGGIKDIKMFGRESGFLEMYHAHNIASAQAGRLYQTLQHLPRLCLELLAVVALASLVLVTLTQGRTLSGILPTLGLFAAIAFRALPSVNRILTAIQSLKYGLPVIETLVEELKLPHKPSTQDDVTSRVDFCELLKVDNVTYTYPGSNVTVLHKVSIMVRAGESVGFVGPSGTGKTTLIDILTGLLKPSSGAVKVDGIDIESNLRGWQNQIGYVPQTVFLTDDTLRRNIAFGLAEHEIDEALVESAIRDAQLQDFVQALPEGLNTYVGERGVRLSGGQRQRIGIARALYHRPTVIILDEATSALDIPTEERVMAAVNALHGRKTILIVAHRFSTVQNCDRFYTLSEGQIEEQCTLPRFGMCQ